MHSSHEKLLEQFPNTPYKALTYIHAMNNYQNSFLTHHVRLLRTYVHHMKSYHGSLLILVTHEIYSDG